LVDGLVLGRNLIMTLIGASLVRLLGPQNLTCRCYLPLAQSMQRADGEKSTHVDLVSLRACLSAALIIEARWPSKV
jgi:hypothetical protein